MHLFRLVIWKWWSVFSFEFLLALAPRTDKNRPTATMQKCFSNRCPKDFFYQLDFWKSFIWKGALKSPKPKLESLDLTLGGTSILQQIQDSMHFSLEYTCITLSTNFKPQHAHTLFHGIHSTQHTSWGIQDYLPTSPWLGFEVWGDNTCSRRKNFCFCYRFQRMFFSSLNHSRRKKIWGTLQRWADIDFSTSDPYPKNFFISISNPYLKISEI